MTQWEYQALHADGLLLEKLNELGAEGWELVAVHVEDFGASRRYLCVLKRPREAQS